MALAKLKIAVLAPIPSASVSTATAVKPGFLKSWRKANLRSFITQCLHRIDLRRAAGGEIAGRKRHDREPWRDHRKDIREMDFSFQKRTGDFRSSHRSSHRL